jgi:putative transposase
MHVHLVTMIKHQQEVPTGQMIRYLAEVSGEVCDDVGADLVECNREDDHMHLLAGTRPRSRSPAW